MCSQQVHVHLVFKVSLRNRACADVITARTEMWSQLLGWPEPMEPARRVPRRQGTGRWRCCRACLQATAGQAPPRTTASWENAYAPCAPGQHVHLHPTERAWLGSPSLPHCALLTLGNQGTQPKPMEEHPAQAASPLRRDDHSSHAQGPPGVPSNKRNIQVRQLGSESWVTFPMSHSL